MRLSCSELILKYKTVSQETAPSAPYRRSSCSQTRPAPSSTRRPGRPTSSLRPSTSSRSCPRTQVSFVLTCRSNSVTVSLSRLPRFSRSSRADLATGGWKPQQTSWQAARSSRRAEVLRSQWPQSVHYQAHDRPQTGSGPARPAPETALRSSSHDGLHQQQNTEEVLTSVTGKQPR